MIRVEMHLHSNYSVDSRLSFENIIKGCKRKKIDVVCITDHNAIEGALEFRKRFDFPIVVGEEIKSEEGEIIGYFLNERIDAGMPIVDTIKAVREQGGLISIPHPFDTLRRARLREGVLDRIIDMVDMIEVFNSRNFLAKADAAALEYCNEKNKVVSVGSDAHSVYEIGRSHMILDGNFTDAGSFLERLRTASYKAKRSSLHVHLMTKWEKWKARNLGRRCG